MNEAEEGRKDEEDANAPLPTRQAASSLPPLCSAFYHGFVRVARGGSKSGEVRFGLPVFGRAIIV
jgi:hypothetical protein